VYLCNFKVNKLPLRVEIFEVWEKDRVKRLPAAYRGNVDRLKPAALPRPKLQYKEFFL
jgi:hypothetical protein